MLADIIIIGIIVLCLVAVGIHYYKRKKSGASGFSCGCGGCSASCNSKKE